MIQQQQLLDDAGRVLVQQAPAAEGKSLRFETKNLVGYIEDRMFIEASDGTERPAHAPIDLIDIAESLRDVMYRSGAGTWFSATIAVSSAGKVSADFNYTDEPAWSADVAPILYVQDFEKYPREDAQMPDWLRQRLAEAENASTE